MRKLIFLLFCMLFLSGSLIARDIEGFWKSINEKTGKTQCVIAVYEYKDKYYGRIIATYNAAGVLDDNIYSPKGKATGVPGSPYFCGMDIIWGLYPSGPSYKGKIIDPRKGTVYNARVWTQNNELIVRGEVLFFGKSHTWFPVQESDFPKGFKRPDVKEFVPVIPPT